MIRIYLDQNKWIDLAKAATGHPSGTRFTEALAAARSAVASGRASFPLDYYRYIETGKNGNTRQRTIVADLMFELSRQHTMALPQTLLSAEVDAALVRLFGKTGGIPTPEVFGVGINHIVPSLRTPELDRRRLPSGAESLSESDLITLEGIFKRLGERELLRAGPETARSMGIDVELAAIEDQLVAHEEKIGDEIRKRGLQGDLIEKAVCASDLGDIQQPVTEGLQRIGHSWESFITYLIQTDTLVQFVNDLPTRHVTNVMRAAKLRQNEQRWERNDFNDIAALPVAVVHCDVVVTEKQWVHHIDKSGKRLGTRYGTTMLSDAAKLVEVLESSGGE
ncbi:hypothetical protein ITJ58_01290 [Curtobacterium flaccumfaciens]|uniref:hypothetical protein n=1 Tax=Curtobacterium flaccumfaciens TaxID=2035 RepID=UPI001889F8D0|nr:hypothetical protein [Curtobacterium flaccumfaciens]MBF4592382.1 hypothetical protein [Curtobacterium flaccumfaciens]